MKRPLFLALGAAVAASGFTVNAAESFSPILGYYTKDVPAGPSTMVIGLVKKKDHQGGMDNQGAFSVSEGMTTVVEDDRDMTTVPLDNHYMEILDGMWEGLILDIEAGSGTTNSFKVNADLTAFPGIALDSTFAIREHATLGDLFPDGGGFAKDNDFVIPFDSAGNPTFYTWDGAAWNAGGTPANDKVIYPGQGFLIIAAEAREVLVGKNGVSHVKENRTMIPFYAAAGLNLVGPPNPVVGKNHELGNMGFVGSIAKDNDFVIPFTDDGLLNPLGFYTSDDVIMNEGGSDASAVGVEVGTAVLLIGSADGYYTAPALDASLLQDQ